MITLSDFQPIISAPAFTYLSKYDNFAGVLANTLNYINSHTGYEFSVDTDLAQFPWLSVAAGWLIEYFTVTHLGGVSDYFWRQCELNFTNAFKLISENKKSTRTGGGAITGEIEGAYS